MYTQFIAGSHDRRRIFANQKTKGNVIYGGVRAKGSGRGWSNNVSLMIRSTAAVADAVAGATKEERRRCGQDDRRYLAE